MKLYFYFVQLYLKTCTFMLQLRLELNHFPLNCFNYVVA